MHFDGDPFTCQCENQDKKAEGVQHFPLLWVVFRWLNGSEGDKGGGVGVSGLTMLVSVMGKTYRLNWKIMYMLIVDVSTPTRMPLLLYCRNYHRVAIKEKTFAITWFFSWQLAKMFVLWQEEGDCEKGCQKETAWKSEAGKYKDTIS